MVSGEQIVPNPWMVLPFIALLAMIALAPLFLGDWWGRHYPKVAYGLGAVTLAYYLGGLHALGRVLQVGHEYISFIALIGSLFVVSGGIHIKVKGEATPGFNVLFLLVGAIVANLLGTTGASMLLIRPWLRLNKYRITAHHVVFFIFIVSNVGGCLTPIGDPPLFLGYLKGVPFWWVAAHCWPAWLVGVGMLLAMFYFVDRHNYLRAPKQVRETLAEPADHWQVEGLANLFFLALILASVFVDRPVFLREAIMVVVAVVSYYSTSKPIHEANHFNFHPIKEVAVLFIGIFATMMPALDWLQANAARLGEPHVGLYYWLSGSLSSVLDNAPTYLSFLSAELGALVPVDLVAQVQPVLAALAGGAANLPAGLAEPIQQTVAALQHYHAARVAAAQVTPEQIQVAHLVGVPALNRFLVAISVGSVFFGANTYIGNGPNFMVKAIADQQKVHTPSFLGYILRFTLPFMLPMLLAVWWLFFRG